VRESLGALFTVLLIGAGVLSSVGAGMDTKLTGSDSVPGDWFGWSAAVSGDTIVVGAPAPMMATGDPAAGPGSAYVFVRSGSTWTEEAKLVPTDMTPDDTFGMSVDVSGDSAVVGAIGDVDAGVDFGFAYVFARSGSTWAQQAKLKTTTGAPFDRFGPVAIDGDTLAVGAYYDDGACPADPSCDSGSVFVFARSGTTWTLQSILTASDANRGDNFGWSLALDGDTLVSGAFNDDDVGLEAGSAYIFIRSGSTWVEQAKLLPNDAGGTDVFRFGYSVSVRGDTAAVGVTGHTVSNRTGAAYVFVRSGTIWTMDAKLVGHDSVHAENAGTSVAVDGDMVVLGSHDHGHAGSVVGSAYVFTRSGKTWEECAEVLAADGSARDYFGASVALEVGTLVVGAPGDDEGVGSAHVFEPCSSPSPPSPCPWSQGYWKNHRADWPVASLTLGSETYDQMELLTLLRTPPRGDATLIMAHQLIAAKLNVANGAGVESIAGALTDADRMLSAFGGKLPYSVHTSSSNGQAMTATAEMLDRYNNKLLTLECAGNGSAPIGGHLIPAADVGDPPENQGLVGGVSPTNHSDEPVLPRENTPVSRGGEGAGIPPLTPLIVVAVVGGAVLSVARRGRTRHP